MREDLATLRQQLDPQRRSPVLEQMVLVGHSMGGLVSKMQAIDSGEEFWRILSERPFEELNADDETRTRLAQTVFFDANPAVRRVITIGTPHRGSDFANDYTRWLGRKLIQLPEWMVNATSQLRRQNPGFFRDTEMLAVNTSIDSLSPESPVIPVLLQSRVAPRTRHHNIVGLVAEEGIMGSLAAGSDGVVSYDSAHLDEVASEITVEADHMGVHRHPRSILEVRRILLEHRVAALAEMGQQVPTTFASYQDEAACDEALASDAARRNAIVIAKKFLNDPENAEYKAVRHEDGYRVFVEFLRRGENGQAVSFPGGHCLITISADGQVTHFVPGS
jgi:pimeloyl-ACP methyl ester carboxylesterase